MDKICKYFNITKRHTEKPYYSMKLVNTHTIDDDLGQLVEDGFVKYVSKVNIICNVKKNDNVRNTVLDMANIDNIGKYAARAVHNLNALHINFLGEPIQILNCQEHVQRQLSMATGNDIANTFIGCDDLVRLYGKTKPHTY